MLRQTRYRVARHIPSARALRLLGCCLGLALLSACAGHTVSPTQEAAEYKSHARHNYTPPGPPEDPWGPYIMEASRRFDVPDQWVRNVMRVESGGRLYRGGDLITSWAGAMGLMQVMPETYDEMRGRYGLGDDAFDPHNNIMAGTAYMREMYDLYGSPGFLAAYNAGPKRLDDYLGNRNSLPEETRHYVAKIGPYIADWHPVNRSPADGLAMNALPMEIPPGMRYARVRSRSGVQTAHNRAQPEWRAQSRLAQAPPIPLPPGMPTSRAGYSSVRYAAAPTTLNRRGGGFHLIPSAMADTLPARRGGGTGWAIQLGAFGNQAQARAAAGKQHGVRTTVMAVQQGHAKTFQARVAGMSRDAAVQACGRKGRNHSCTVLSPNAQS